MKDGKSTCRSCGASIVFIETKNKKLMPCNPNPVRYWPQAGGRGRVITGDGTVVSCDFAGDPTQEYGWGYTPHWATCSGASNHRKRG